MPCEPCPIPLRDLTFSWIDNGGGTTSGSVAFRLAPPADRHGFPGTDPAWASDEVYFDNPSIESGYRRFWMYCDPDFGTSIFESNVALVPGRPLAYPGGVARQLVLFAPGSSCGPLHLEFHGAAGTANYPICFVDE